MRSDALSFQVIFPVAESLVAIGIGPAPLAALYLTIVGVYTSFPAASLTGPTTFVAIYVVDFDLPSPITTGLNALVKVLVDIYTTFLSI